MVHVSQNFHDLSRYPSIIFLITSPLLSAKSKARWGSTNMSWCSTKILDLWLSTQSDILLDSLGGGEGIQLVYFYNKTQHNLMLCAKINVCKLLMFQNFLMFDAKFFNRSFIFSCAPFLYIVHFTNSVNFSGTLLIRVEFSCV